MPFSPQWLTSLTSLRLMTDDMITEQALDKVLVVCVAGGRDGGLPLLDGGK